MSEFFIYFHILVEYSFSKGLRLGVIMKRQMHAVRLTPAPIHHFNIDPQLSVNINNREIAYLRRGLHQPGGKLPLFDLDGQEFEAAVIRRCVEQGWAEPWFSNPLMPDWLVCRLTASGRALVARILDLDTAVPPRVPA